MSFEGGEHVRSIVIAERGLCFVLGFFRVWDVFCGTLSVVFFVSLNTIGRFAFWMAA